MLAEQIARLIAVGIEVVPMEHMSRHVVLARDGFVVLVERKDDSLANIGSAGLLTEHGFAVLTSSEGKPQFVARGHQQPATAAQLETLHAFERDVREALR